MHGRRRGDRRSQKTDAVLRQALADLIRERPYEQIAVKDILDRANVGRSTFYIHFCDKDELLLSCIHEVLSSAESGHSARGQGKPLEALIRFSRPIFDHIEGHRRVGRMSPTPGGRRELHEHLRDAITELIQDEVGRALLGSKAAGGLSRELLARWISSTFVLVLDWWVDSDSPTPAAEADRRFRALVEPALVQVLGRPL